MMPMDVIMMRIYERQKTDDPDLYVIVASATNINDPDSQSAEVVFFFNARGNYIGTASISGIDLQNGYLYNFHVNYGCRGMGYGTKIMKYMMTHYSITILSVEPFNKIAINLYKKFGFVEGHSYYENGRKLIAMTKS